MHLDEYLWFFFWVLLIIAFYEHFYEKDYGSRVRNKLIYFAFGLGVFAIIGTMVVFLSNPDALKLPYVYAVLGTAALIPAIIAIFRNPKLLPKLLAMIPFFFFVYLGFELLALHMVGGILVGNILAG